MNILFLLSSLEPAGSETYCVALANTWGTRHNVFWISDQLHFGQVHTSMPISQKAFPGGILNAFRVLSYVRKHHIEIIHSHSRRSHWIAAQVSALTGIPHVATIHQPPPLHLFSKLFPCLGDHAIAIDEVIVDHLKQNFGRRDSNVSLIRNGIDLRYYGGELMTSAPADYHPKKILVLGRLSGGRWNAIQFLFAGLKRFGSTLPKTHYQLAGRVPEERTRPLTKQITELNSILSPSSVEVLGFVSDLRPYFESCDGAIAGGRSAMESMAFGKPVVILGEGGVIGLSRPETMMEALRTNFGDHLTGEQFVLAKLEVGLRELLDSNPPILDFSRWCRQQIASHYDIQLISKQVEELYQSIKH